MFKSVTNKKTAVDNSGKKTLPCDKVEREDVENNNSLFYNYRLYIAFPFLGTPIKCFTYIRRNDYRLTQ